MVRTFLKLVTMTKMKTGIIGAIVVAGLATSLLVQHQARVKLREENQALRRQIAQLESDNQQASNRVLELSESSSLDSERLRELLRLRGEVGLLRRNQRESQPSVAAAQSKPSDIRNQPNKPAPFQVQIVLDEPAEDSETITNSASGAREETLYVQKTPLLDYTALKSAALGTNASTGAPEIDIEFNEVGKDLFAQVTKANLNKRLAIVVDGQLQSAPVIRSEISGGKAQVTGSFTEDEARELAAKINEAITSK